MMVRSDAVVVGKERCPQCERIGKDRSGDNLAIYSDGHKYCFSCGYYRRAGFYVPKEIKEALPATTIALPEDVTTELPYEARQWLDQYELTQLDIKKHHCMWSQRWSRLIFPYFVNGELLAWQGRYIPTEHSNPRSAKWFSQGKIHEFIHTINVTKRQAIIVEDIVSAIKVSKFTGTIPLFGSTVSQHQILRYKYSLDKVWYWLDPDKRSESVPIAFKTCNLGLPAGVLLSEKDPKEHTNDEIKKILIDSGIEL